MGSLSKYILNSKTARTTSFVRRLLLKKKLLKEGNPDHAKIKTALIIGGGGMRSVYSGGILTGIKKLGLSDVFDVVVGISAGSGVCAAFLSGQPELGTSVYYEDLSGKKFINPARILKIMDIDYLDYIFRRVKPLNQKKIRSSRSEFYVTVTDAVTGKGELLNMKDKKIDIIDAICASASLPVIYNKTITIKGKEYCDGAMGNGIPIDFLVKKGCTHILIVLNNALGKKPENVPIFERLFARLYMKKFTPSLRAALLERNRLYNKTLDSIDKFKNVNIGILTPQEMPLKRMSRDKMQMKRVAKIAEKQVQEIFSVNN